MPMVPPLDSTYPVARGGDLGLKLHSPKLVWPLIPSDLWKGLRLNECVSGEACWWVSGPQDVAEISSV